MSSDGIDGVSLQYNEACDSTGSQFIPPGIDTFGIYEDLVLRGLVCLTSPLDFPSGHLRIQVLISIGH